MAPAFEFDMQISLKDRLSDKVKYLDGDKYEDEVSEKIR